MANINDVVGGNVLTVPALPQHTQTSNAEERLPEMNLLMLELEIVCFLSGVTTGVSLIIIALLAKRKPVDVAHR